MASGMRTAKVYIQDCLIPEGWLLETVHKNWKVDMRDRFGLLLASCRDCTDAERSKKEHSQEGFPGFGRKLRLK